MDWNTTDPKKAHYSITTTATQRLADGTVDRTLSVYDGANDGGRTPSTTTTTSYSYTWFERAQQTEIRAKSDNADVKGNWAPGFSHYIYDDYGRIKLAYDEAGNRGFSYQVDGEGRILQRDELIGGTVQSDGSVTNATQNRHHSYYLFDDKQVGNVGNDGIDRIDYAKELALRVQQNGAANDASHKRFTPVAGADFDVNYQPINSLYPTAAPGSVIVRAGDTLQSIAMALWGDSSLWYLIADANGLAPNQPLIPNTVLTVPNKVTNIHNNAGTFKPYDARSAMGNTSPTVPDAPPPPQAKGNGCGGFIQVIAIVVAVVVTIYTAGAAAAAMGAATAAGSTGAMAVGAAAIGGSAVGISTGAMIGAAAIGGAVGSIASQGVLMAGGVQKGGLNWGNVGLSAIGAAVTAGIGASPVGQALRGASTSAGTFARGAATGAINSAVTNGVGSLLNVSHFSWQGVAISAASAGAGALAARTLGQVDVFSGDGVAARAARGAAAGITSGAVSAAARGNFSGASLQQIGLDVLGSTIGNSIVDVAAAKNTALPSNANPDDDSWDRNSALSKYNAANVQNGLEQYAAAMARPWPTMNHGAIRGPVVDGDKYDPSTLNWHAEGFVASGTANPADAKTLPMTVVTADGVTGEYATALNEWADRYHLPTPALSSSMSQLRAYRHDMYAQTAPAYQQWVNQSFPTTPRSIAQRGYPDIGNDIEQWVAQPIDKAMARVQELSHEGAVNARDWATDGDSSAYMAAHKVGLSTLVTLGDGLVQAATGMVRVMTNPAAKVGIAFAAGNPGDTAALAWQHIKGMSSEELGTASFVTLADGVGALQKLGVGTEAATATRFTARELDAIAAGAPSNKLTIAANSARGNPSAIFRELGKLNSRQAAVLEKLPEFGSNVIVSKSFGQRDLTALTAATGDEFAMFSAGGRRLIYRGDAGSVPITPELGEKLSAQGWRWSSHVHPGADIGVLRSSTGDRAVLDAMGGQRSAIFNSIGQRRLFTPQGDSLEGWRPSW